MATAKKGTGKKPIDIAVEKLTEKIKTLGFLPWTRPHLLVMPRNYITGKEYTGINIWLLYGGSGEFITINQLRDYNKKFKEKEDMFFVKKGSKAEFILYYNVHEKEIPESVARERRQKGQTWGLIERDGKYYEKSAFARYTNVFDITCVENSKGEKLPTKVRHKNPKEIERNQDAEKLIHTYFNRHKVTFKEARGIPHCNAQGTEVVMPPMNDFKGEEEYYRTFLHEAVHTTGRADLLNRSEFIRYKDKDRNREELVAEAGSAKLAMICGYTDDTFAKLNSDIYIAGWCKWMADNPNELVRGLNEVEKAVEMILNANGLGLVEEVKDGEVKTTAKSLEKTKKKVAFEDYLVSFVKATDKTNKGRTAKVWGRILKGGYDKFIEDIGFKQYAVVEGNPVFQLPLTKEGDKRLVMGMTFGFIVKIEGGKVTEYKLLYSLERGNSITDVSELAKKYKIKQLFEFTKLMDLRGSLGTYEPVK